LSHEQVARFLNHVPDNVLVYFDEAYFEFAPADFPRTLEFFSQRKNIMFSRTFSKAYGLAGLRIGYGVAPLAIADLLNKIREPFNINRFAQVAAGEALKQKSFLKKVIRHTNKEKKFIYNELKKLSLDFVPSATNFIMINLRRDTRDCCDYLLQKGVVVRGLTGWGLANCFRVTVGLHKENTKFITEFKRYLFKSQI
jgi:histidinol-phosphate aminotransferase